MNLSEIIQFVKADIIVIWVCTKSFQPSLRSVTFCVLMEVKPGFRDQKKCSFPLSRGAPSREVTDTKITEYVNIFFGAKFCVPWVKVSERKCFTAHLPRVVKIWKIEAGSVFKRVANAQSVLKIICPPKDTSTRTSRIFFSFGLFLNSSEASRTASRSCTDRKKSNKEY